ncbi:hypothetical protein M3Y97_00335400 [Aphelenchoides bicaudatus]|nr:hypothetical protein M3Y97_00335400 [Aphelenchoides bicaudatus]
MPRQRKIISAAWEYFVPVEGGAQCKIPGCDHRFLKRASGSSTKFLWSHLDAHHTELSKELGRQGKKKTRTANETKEITNGRSETIDVHCYPATTSASAHVSPNFVYAPNNIPSSSNTMSLMDLIANDTLANNLNTTVVESTPPQPVLSVNEYFCKMLCAQLNQMNEKQAHLCREKFQSFVGQILYTDQQPQQVHKILPFNSQYS